MLCSAFHSAIQIGVCRNIGRQPKSMPAGFISSACALSSASLSSANFFFNRSSSGPFLLISSMLICDFLVIGCSRVRTKATRQMMAMPQSLKKTQWKHQRMKYSVSISQVNVMNPHGQLV